MITSDTIVAASSYGFSSDLGSETIVLDTRAGEYWSLNPVCARIWELVREPVPVHRIVSTLLAEFDVTPERCEREVRDVLLRMEAAGLIETGPPSDASRRRA